MKPSRTARTPSVPMKGDVRPTRRDMDKASVCASAMASGSQDGPIARRPEEHGIDQDPHPIIDVTSTGLGYAESLGSTCECAKRGDPVRSLGSPSRNDRLHIQGR